MTYEFLVNKKKRHEYEWKLLIITSLTLTYHNIELETVLSEQIDVPHLIFSFSTIVTLKIRPRWSKSNTIFDMSNSYIQENCVRIQPLI